METIRAAAQRAKESSYRLPSISLDVRNAALEEIAQGLKEEASSIITANNTDMVAANKEGVPQVLMKRLRYDEEKLTESIRSIRALIDQEDVVGNVLSRTELDEGLVLEKVSCPIGVIGVVFESRPDALVQISTLCLRSGNAVLLKGGIEAKETNKALSNVIIDAITRTDNRFKDSVTLLGTREEFRELLALDDLVDLIIPEARTS